MRTVSIKQFSLYVTKLKSTNYQMHHSIWYFTAKMDNLRNIAQNAIYHIQN
jgi:hypothetical protein